MASGMMSRCVARVTMSQSEYALRAEECGQCERETESLVRYMREQVAHMPRKNMAGELWHVSMVAIGNQPMGVDLSSTGWVWRTTLLAASTMCSVYGSM